METPEKFNVICCNCNNVYTDNFPQSETGQSFCSGICAGVEGANTPSKPEYRSWSFYELMTF